MPSSHTSVSAAILRQTDILLFSMRNLLVRENKNGGWTGESDFCVKCQNIGCKWYEIIHNGHIVGLNLGRHIWNRQKVLKCGEDRVKILGKRRRELCIDKCPTHVDEIKNAAHSKIKFWNNTITSFSRELGSD